MACDTKIIAGGGSGGTSPVGNPEGTKVDSKEIVTNGGPGVFCWPCTAEIEIVNEDGTPATDTILREGSNDYKISGCCPWPVEWSVSVDAGSSLGGSTISSSGILTAGATACGSLKVTATCPSCGTSAIQYVRVTDAGKWELYASCKSNPWYGKSELCSPMPTEHYYSGQEWWVQSNVCRPDNPSYPCGWFGNDNCTAILSTTCPESCGAFNIYCFPYEWKKYKWVCA